MPKSTKNNDMDKIAAQKHQFESTKTPPIGGNMGCRSPAKYFVLCALRSGWLCYNPLSIERH